MCPFKHKHTQSFLYVSIMYKLCEDRQLSLKYFYVKCQKVQMQIKKLGRSSSIIYEKNILILLY